MIEMKRMRLARLEAAWRKLTSENSNISPFHEFEFAEKLAKAYRLPKRRRHLPVWEDKPVFYAFCENGNVLLIAPLIRTRAPGGTFYQSFGARFRIVYEDFIYADDLAADTLARCLDMLKAKLGRIRFYFQAPGTKLYEALEKSGRQINAEIMCKIRLPETFDEYYRSLGRKLRNNVRNNVNRLKRNGCRTSFAVYRGNEMPGKEYGEFLSIYDVSWYRKNGRSRSKIKNAYRSYVLRARHPYATTMNAIPSSLLACYRINGELAAACGGYVDPLGRYIVVHRMARNPKYDKYIPGHMMALALIRYMIEKTSVRVYDLSKGDEPYKYMLGAESFYQYGFEIGGEVIGK